jgi:signal-transduction protein with cAMP-binding, CBS, and nucleotidyltransferase domain
MAANPKWCLSVTEWKKNFAQWVLKATPETILEVHVSFDLRCAHGDEALVDELRDEVQTLTGKSPEFFLHFARNCLGYKAPLGLLGRIRTEKRAGEKTINVKECLKPLETFARIYALRHGLRFPGTLDRLKALREADVLQDGTFREIIYVFDYLWKLRFYNQIAASAELSTDTDDLDVERLTDIERNNLQAVLSRIPDFQTRLSYDFLGVASP